MKLFLLLPLSLLFCCSLPAQYVAVKPPIPLSAANERVCPAPQLWIKGEWQWEDAKKRYLWVEGHCAIHRKGYTYISGRWKKKPQGWIWIPGYWQKIKRNGKLVKTN
jgi:hypothetical protein